jgi:hypothetical protein
MLEKAAHVELSDAVSPEREESILLVSLREAGVSISVQRRCIAWGGE